MEVCRVLESPLGWILLEEREEALVRLSFWEAPPQREQKLTPLLEAACSQLEEFFRRERTTFTIPLWLEGTPFQRKVWQTLCTIPYGHCWSYEKLACAIGHPRAARAVGQANRANPIPIFVPCHRVIRKGGALGGFSSGLWRKRWLISLERGKGER